MQQVLATKLIYEGVPAFLSAIVHKTAEGWKVCAESRDQIGFAESLKAKSQRAHLRFTDHTGHDKSQKFEMRTSRSKFVDAT